MAKPIIHLFAPASPGAVVLEDYNLSDGRELIARCGQAAGDGYRLRGRASIIDGILDEKQGGRVDDNARIREIEQVLADDNVAAMVAVRGGAWLTRLLPHIDFSVMDKRKRPVSLFGFSEITPLINMIGKHPMGYGYYYMTPGFPRSGMARYGRLNINRIARGQGLTGKAAERFADKWAKKQAEQRFDEYFQEIIGILEGRGSQRKFVGTLVAGRMDEETRATVIGGCLSLVTPLTTAPFVKTINPKNKWVALEDLEENPYRLDRQFAHLKLAGWFEKCAGLIIGDFHMGDENQTEEVLAMLKYHLPSKSRLPIVVTKDMGHIWPQSPLPLGRRVSLCLSESRRGKSVIELKVPWEKWRTV